MYILGDPHGDLADNFQRAFSEVRVVSGDEKQDLSDGAVLLFLPEGKAIGAGMATGLRSAFDAGQVTAIVHANETEINAFLAALGLEPSYAMDPDVASSDHPYEDFYAVRKALDGFLHTWIAANDEIAPTVLTPVSDDTPPTEAEEEAFQDSRLARFTSAMLQPDLPGAALASAERRALLRAAGGDRAELTEVAAAEMKTWDFSIYGQSFLVSSTVYSCHNFGDGSDYFLVKQTAMLNPSGNYKRTEGHGTTVTHVKGYMVSYAFENNWPDGFGGGENVLLVRSEPKNANGVTTLTSGMQWNLGGNIGFQGKNPTGGLAGSPSARPSRSPWRTARWRTAPRRLRHPGNTRSRVPGKGPNTGAGATCMTPVCSRAAISSPSSTGSGSWPQPNGRSWRPLHASTAVFNGSTATAMEPLELGGSMKAPNTRTGYETKRRFRFP